LLIVRKDLKAAWWFIPGEEKVIKMKLKNSYTRGERPVVEISGFNL
jgi:hypothetical protein